MGIHGKSRTTEKRWVENQDDDNDGQEEALALLVCNDFRTSLIRNAKLSPF